MSPTEQESTSLGDTLYETFYSGAVGGTVIAAFFLLRDLVAGQPLFTPSLLGSVLFLDSPAGPEVPVRMGAVAYMTLVHLLAFGALGLVASILVRRIRSWAGDSFVVPALALLLLLEGGFVTAATLWMPGVVGVLGGGVVLLANVLAAVAMTGFLRYARRSGAEVTSGAENATHSSV